MALKLVACVLYIFRLVIGLQVPGIYGSQCGEPIPDPTPVSQQPLGKRIVGGTAASPGEWPWMVMLKKNGDIKCGGSIINQYMILTAAHCFNGEQQKLNDWEVYVGKRHANIKDKNEKRHTIARVIPHEKFVMKTLMNDIAIIIVKEPIVYTSYVRPICLPRKNQAQGQCYTTGWGETYGTGNEDVLKEIQLDPKVQALCRALLKTMRKSSLINVFCAGYQNWDACTGDSGGPFSCKINGKWYLKGIVSFGPDCANPDWPGFYVNVTAYLRWINKNIYKIRREMQSA